MRFLCACMYVCAHACIGDDQVERCVKSSFVPSACGACVPGPVPVGILFSLRDGMFGMDVIGTSAKYFTLRTLLSELIVRNSCMDACSKSNTNSTRRMTIRAKLCIHSVSLSSTFVKPLRKLYGKYRLSRDLYISSTFELSSPTVIRKPPE